MIETIQWTDEGVVMINQTRLPAEETYVTCRTYQEVADAIRTMIIRGAPAIGVAAAMGVAIGVAKANPAELDAQLEVISKELASTRPTAVNLFWAIDRMNRLYREVRHLPFEEVRDRLIAEAKLVRAEDIEINVAMGKHGAPLVPDGKTVLTHCNAGALATAGYGTALGVIRAAIESGKNIDVYADETRPFLQGARLTVWRAISCAPARSAAWLSERTASPPMAMSRTRSARTRWRCWRRRTIFRSMWPRRFPRST